MWTYYRILNMMKDKVTNQEVLKRMSKETELVKIVNQRKLQFLGHVMRNSKYEVLQKEKLSEWFGHTTRPYYEQWPTEVYQMLANIR